MRLVNFQMSGASQPWRAGLLDNGHVVPVTAPSSRGTAADPALEVALAARAGVTVCTGEPVTAADVLVGTPVLRPSKIVAAVGNYLDHVREMSDGRQPRTVPEQGFFLKASSSLLPAGGRVLLPYPDRRTDYEGELAAVIGRTASRVSEEQAWECVLGYTCLLDISLRGSEDRGYRKSFDTFTPLGPALVTADEVTGLGDRELCTQVNGETRQRARLSEMILDVGMLTAEISEVMTLSPGDVIATGTPKGVGPLAPGDRVEVEVTGMGTLAVDVGARSAVSESPVRRREGHADDQRFVPLGTPTELAGGST